MALLDVKNVRKVYTTRFGGNQVEALKDVNFSVEQGEYVAIMGESSLPVYAGLPGGIPLPSILYQIKLGQPLFIGNGTFPTIVHRQRPAGEGIAQGASPHGRIGKNDPADPFPV